MKKLKYLILLVLISFTLSACSITFNPTTTMTITSKRTYTGSTISYSVPNPNNPDGYQVIFDFGDGNKITTNTNKSNHVIKPDDPTKNFAYFVGWYYNNELFDFNKSINSDIILTARWEYDYESLVNYIYKNTIKSCIKVETYAYTNGFIRQSYSDSIGSGVIFDEDDNYYYALTNNHVVYYDSSKYKNVEYHIYDCYSNVYGDPQEDSTLRSELIGNKPEYDLALLKFTKGSKTLEVAKMANSSESYKVFSLGNPKSLTNAISFGEITGTKTFTPKEETKDKSNVSFDVLTHSSELNNGSSGGGLFNFNLELVGINFASSVSTSDEFIRGYTIPIEKVKEFINIYKNKSS
ncbi:MAG: trypsin-like peptidase domain-containing protein [Acholeplasmatales bacterium]|nr:trypsin-like peptidase domain-containing protein [Acholeplasmatales bacterium]